MSEYSYEDFEQEWREDDRQARLVRQLGQVPCRGDHDFEAQNAVSNVDLWFCPRCGSAV